MPSCYWDYGIALNILPTLRRKLLRRKWIRTISVLVVTCLSIFLCRCTVLGYPTFNVGYFNTEHPSEAMEKLSASFCYRFLFGSMWVRVLMSFGMSVYSDVYVFDDIFTIKWSFSWRLLLLNSVASRFHWKKNARKRYLYQWHSKVWWQYHAYVDRKLRKLWRKETLFKQYQY